MTLGLLLLAAAVLKSVPMFGDSAATVGQLFWRGSVAAVGFETLLGVWLVSNWQSRICRSVALLVFAIIALISLVKAFSDAASCGCFVPLVVHPWLMFAVDFSAMLLLADHNEAAAAGHFSVQLAPVLLGRPARVSRLDSPQVGQACVRIYPPSVNLVVSLRIQPVTKSFCTGVIFQVLFAPVSWTSP